MAAGGTSVRARSELVIALVGAIGTDLELVANRIGSILTDEFKYSVDHIGMSDLLKTVAWPDGRDLSPTHWDLRTQARMDAGRDLCKGWGTHDALAQLAELQISRCRDAATGNASGQPAPARAYILRSLKRPAEVARLRAVYGSRFVLFGAYSPREHRRARIIQKLEASYASRDESKFALSINDDLLGRDEKETGEGGQNVRDTFHRSDFFVETHTSASAEAPTAELEVQIRRSLRVLFGDPFVTPTKDEAAMAQADRAARRSAEPGRQVGAAVVNGRGDVLAVGCNEVPRAFGGQYWGDDPGIAEKTAVDGREMHRDRDTNNVRQKAIAVDVIKSIETSLTEAARKHPNELVDSILRSTLGDITEYGRAVHAEMAAITTAARLGVPLHDATVLTDTFPCHNCARHIIATGIRRVVYIAPYAKSQAKDLHDDSILVAPSGGRDTRPKDHVIFEPFIGVAPRRFDELFAGLKRKTSEGVIIKFEPTTAHPRVGVGTDPAADEDVIADLEVIAYTSKESADLQAFRKRLPSLNPPLLPSGATAA